MSVRLAAIRLVATPLFTLFAVLSLALGVAVTTAVYSVVGDLMLRGPGVHDPETVVVFVNSYDRRTVRVQMSEPDYRDLRAAQRSFSSLSGSAMFFATVTTASTTEMMGGEAVDGEYFSTLGVGAAIGRVLQPPDQAGLARVAVLSHALWRVRFAADPQVVGRTIRIGGEPFDIVGVTDAPYLGTFGGLDGTRLWIPLGTEAAPSPAFSSAPASPAARDRRRLQVFGRLAPSVTETMASAELRSIAARLDAQFPPPALPGRAAPSPRPWSAKSLAAFHEANDGVRRFGYTIVALVSLVLVVACTNLANLMLARGTARQKELAIRSALGASRWRLVREQCAESVLLAGGGAAAAYLVFQGLRSWMTADFNLMGRWTLLIRPALDPAAVGVAAAALLLSLAVFGLEPAVHLARTVNLNAAMAAGTARSRTRRQRLVVRWQVAVAAGFFIIATMFVRSTIAQARHDSGVDIDRIAVASLSLLGPQWDEARVQRTIDRIVAEGRKEASLEALSASTGLPFGVAAMRVSISRPGEAIVEHSYRSTATGVAATPGVFATLGIPVLRGRAFDDRDHAAAPTVAVVSEFTARRMFGTIDAVGQSLALHRGPNQSSIATVIGVARDTDVRAILADPTPLVYLPLTQHFSPALTIVARSTGEAARAVPALREVLRRAEPDAPVDVSGTGRTVLSGPFEILRAGGMGALYLGAMTLLLAMVGLFGVQSHLIVHRTREIGVRMSMGATTRQIKAMVLLDGYRPVLEGLVLGLWGGFAGRVLVRAYLELDVAIVDPWMLAVTPIPIVLAAFCACYLPAHRAAAVDPTIALRCE